MNTAKDMSLNGAINRRRFLSTLGGAGAALVLGQKRSHAAASETTSAHEIPTLYYMDGYHGGPRGHMPPGCWRDILDALERNPLWKLSFDVEAETWTVLRREDPETYRRFQQMLQSPDSRVEITGGTFSQPYGWAISGESNIRQMQRGLQFIEEHFPGVHVSSYAVQEPCWASCLPQILTSFGFTGASLKNASTAWGGYFQGFDAERVRWIGPDGSHLLAVPRYQVEALLNVWETEATEVTPEYARKCVDHGIPEPAGMCFQDLGWAAQPRVTAPWIRFATWTEYIHTVAKGEPVDFHVSMEDILTALPWGEKTLHSASREVREAEVRLLQAEKCLAMSFMLRHAAWPVARLQAAWDQAMLSQAHDAWITVTTRSGRQAWSFVVASETMDASNTAQELIDEALTEIASTDPSQVMHPAGVQYLRVVNTLGSERTGLVEVTVSADPGTESFAVIDLQGHTIPSQATTVRSFRNLPRFDGLHTPVMEHDSPASASSASINAATVVFRDTLPAFGWKTYRIVPHPEPSPSTSSISVHSRDDGSVTVETDLYRVTFDARRGGAIASLYVHKLKKEFCSEGKLLNQFRGFFVGQDWRSSSDNPAEIRILEPGPIRVRLQISGTIGGHRFQATTTLVQGQAAIECQVTFHFNQDTWIGDPWEIRPEDRMKERRRSSNKGSPKLQAIFPVAFEHGGICKNSAFDVCRSRHASTDFERWDEIKHNIVTNWVDLYDEHQDLGLAILSDRTTAYSHAEGQPLGLVLGWGGEAGYWWGQCPLRGEQESHYAFVPHHGSWTEAGLWQQNQSWEEPLLARVIPAPDASGATDSRSLIRVSPAHAILSSVTVVQGDIEARVFFANDRDGTCQLEMSAEVESARLVELDGRLIEPLSLRRDGTRASTVNFAISRFGIRTIRMVLSSKPSGKAGA